MEGLVHLLWRFAGCLVDIVLGAEFPDTNLTLVDGYVSLWFVTS
jgi:hypothetical protein